MNTKSNIVTLDVDSGGMPNPIVRQEILDIEARMNQAIEDENIDGVETDDWVRHIFAPGVYAREMTIKEGTMIVGKLHKTEHINIISKGDISVKTEFRTDRYQAPCVFVSRVGTKRVVFAHTETVWTTIHPTEETDLEEIEKHVIAKSYIEIPLLGGDT
jgi:hypothetical protein